MRCIVFLAVIVSLLGTAGQAVAQQDLRYPSLSQPRNSPAPGTRVRPPLPAPPQQPAAGRPFMRIPLIDSLLPRLGAAPPRWPTGQPPQQPQPMNPAATPLVPLAPAVAPRRVVRQTKFIAVIGDKFAQDLNIGLSSALATRPEIGLIRTFRPNAGLAGKRGDEWASLARDAAQRKPLHAIVVFIGAVDTASAPEAETDMDSTLLAERYAMRVDDILLAVRESAVPVVWVGLPPVKDEKLSNEHTFINGFIRQRVTAGGGSFVDIWEAFVDSEGRFAADGPNVDGRITALRGADGTGFTRAGARKLGYYVDLEIRQIFDTKNAPAPEAADLSALQNTLPSTRLGASRILVLSSPARTPGGGLLEGGGQSATADFVRRALEKTLQLQAPEGRTDSYSWTPHR
jgi:hypothetical protein